MNKSILSLGVAIGTALAIGTSAKADAKVITPEEAATMLDAKANAVANKTAKTKDQRTVKFEVKVTGQKKKAKKKSLRGQIDKINKHLTELAIDDIGSIVDPATSTLADDPAIEDLVSETIKDYYREKELNILQIPGSNDYDDGEKSNDEAKLTKITIKGKKAIVKVEIRNKNSFVVGNGFYGEKYHILDVNDFATRINSSMTEREKGWEAARFVMEHMSYGTGSISFKDFHEGKAKGICSTLAREVATYMQFAGVKHFGTVISDNADHEWNFLKDESGTIWYFDAQDVDDVVLDWERGNLCERDQLANPSVWDRTHGLTITQMEKFFFYNREDFIDSKGDREDSGFDTNDWEFRYWSK